MSGKTHLTVGPAVGKYINPMLDYGFKVIFKESGKKQLLIRPLNEVFGLDIVDLEIRESEQMGLIKEAHRASYDLHCTSQDGSRFIVEVQLGDQRFFNERALFYTALPIAKSMPKLPTDVKTKKKKKKGKKKGIRWNYTYPPVFFMGLLNFDIRHLNPAQVDPEQYIHLFSLRDEQTGELMTDRLRFAFLEVARFEKGRDECKTFEDRFLYMMKNLPTFVTEPELWDDDPYFREFLQVAEYANMTERQQERYIAKMKVIWDNENVREFAIEQAVEKATKETTERVTQDVSEQIARRMLAKNKDIAEIVELTGLTEEQVAALQ